MSILIDASTRVIVQGYTGDKATFHAKEMIAYGTNVPRSHRRCAGWPDPVVPDLRERQERARSQDFSRAALLLSINCAAAGLGATG